MNCQYLRTPVRTAGVKGVAARRGRSRGGRKWGQVTTVHRCALPPVALAPVINSTRSPPYHTRHLCIVLIPPPSPPLPSAGAGAGAGAPR